MIFGSCIVSGNELSSILAMKVNGTFVHLFFTSFDR